MMLKNKIIDVEPDESCSSDYIGIYTAAATATVVMMCTSAAAKLYLYIYIGRLPSRLYTYGVLLCAQDRRAYTHNVVVLYIYIYIAVMYTRMYVFGAYIHVVLCT